MGEITVALSLPLVPGQLPHLTGFIPLAVWLHDSHNLGATKPWVGCR